MNFANAARAYSNVGLETAVGSADSLGLVLMLYDGAIMAVSKAQVALAERNLRVKGESISKAIQIIEEGLRASLDRKAGGDIAKQLDSLYEYMCQKLLMASMANDVAPMAEIVKLLSDLRETWASLAKRPAVQSGAKPAAAPLAAAQPRAMQANPQAAQARTAPAAVSLPQPSQPAAQAAPVPPSPQSPVAAPAAAKPLFKQAAAAYAARGF